MLYGYQEASFPFPVCNHTQEVSTNNEGYIQGLFDDGMPFEAELWTDGDEVSISVMLSQGYKPDIKDGNDNVSPFRLQHDSINKGILYIGMVENGQEENLDVIIALVECLENQGIIEFEGQYRNGYVVYYTDREGTDLTYITVLLSDSEKEYGTTPLKFWDFPGRPKKKGFTVVK